MKTYLYLSPSGEVFDFGRHTVIDGKRVGYGPAVCYSGEAAEVMRLVLKYTKSKNSAERNKRGLPYR